jgi:hypothetical protein
MRLVRQWSVLIVQQDRRQPDIYILDTISPGDNAVRQWGKFEHGSEWQGDVFNWLYINWEAFRELRRPSYGRAMAAKWDMPLRFVGDWHKQPGDMIAPSGGDLQTARAMITDPETPDHQFVAPIVTMYPVVDEEKDELEEAAETSEDTSVEAELGLAESTPAEITEEEAAKTADRSDLEDNKATEETFLAPDPMALPTNAIVRPSEDEEWLVRIDFWYISKRIMRNFAPITPVVWPDDRLPSLPSVAWHLIHRAVLIRKCNCWPKRAMR